MPKVKTHKSTSKRFRVTGTGKLMRTRQGKSHFRRNRSARLLADLPEMHEVDKTQVKRIHKLALQRGLSEEEAEVRSRQKRRNPRERRFGHRRQSKLMGTQESAGHSVISKPPPTGSKEKKTWQE